MAPEIVNKVEYSGPQADIWALGVLLYALLNGWFPFKGRTDEELYMRINECDFAIYKHMSRAVRDLLTRMLDIDPDTWITASEILQHKWIVDNEKLIQNIFYDPEAEDEEHKNGESKDSYLTTKQKEELKGKFINKEACMAYFNTKNPNHSDP